MVVGDCAVIEADEAGLREWTVFLTAHAAGWGPSATQMGRVFDWFDPSADGCFVSPDSGVG